MKTCSKCKVSKNESEFSVRSTRSDSRLQSHCKPCKLEDGRAYNIRNPGAAKKAVDEWVLRNPEKAAEMYRRNARKYRARNLESEREKVKKWQRENREKARIYTREYARKNPGAVRAATQKWKTKNPLKVRELFREWAKKNPMKVEDNRLRKYGLTTAQWEHLLTAQGERCAICKNTANGKRKFAVDHDHKTGKVRGLLCARCNTALGLLRDSQAIVQAAADYLKKHS